MDRRSINYREYDNLFEKAKIDGGSISEDIAVGRLLYPVELDDRYRLMYEEYVAGSGLSILKRYIEGAKDDPASAVNMIRELLRYSGGKELFSRGTIDEAISCSVELGLTEVTAILMESGSGAGSEKSAAMRFEF